MNLYFYSGLANEHDFIRSIRLKKDLISVFVEVFVDCLEFIDHPPEELCMIAVNSSGYALKYIRPQTRNVCFAAVQKDGLAIKHVLTQTKLINEAAIKQNPMALCYITKQTFDLCVLAATLKESTVWLIRNDKLRFRVMKHIVNISSFENPYA